MLTPIRFFWNAMGSYSGLLALLFFSSACSFAPRIQQTEAVELLPDTYDGAMQDTTRAQRAWWEDFNDPTLNLLVDSALTRNLDLRIAINISARMLQDVGFPAQISTLLRDKGVCPEQIELEITESAMMVDPQRALKVIQDLSELGFLISVDDYGTGYSSLAYLRDLPVHALKLDRSFVMNLQQHNGNRVIVESTVQMAHALNLMVVAEGIETQRQLSYLQELECNEAQGFLFGEPAPASEILPLLHPEQ